MNLSTSRALKQLPRMTDSITFDKQLIASKGYRTITPVIVTNSFEFSAVNRKATGEVTPKERTLELVKE